MNSHLRFNIKNPDNSKYRFIRGNFTNNDNDQGGENQEYNGLKGYDDENTL